jgi:hypothetical protein
MPVGSQVIYKITGTGSGHSGDDLLVQALVIHNREDTNPNDDQATADILLLDHKPSGGGGKLPWTGTSVYGIVTSAGLVGLLGLGMVLARRRLRG